jgi:tripartite ATP-independent transporter DctP family solute receptor
MRKSDPADHNDPGSSGSQISRRRFAAGLTATGGLALLGGQTSFAGDAAAAELRQYHNQPAESPLHKNLVAMWAAVKAETGGRVQVRTFPENNQMAGGDPAALAMLIDGSLDFFAANGALIGSVVPAANVQGIPFAFRTLAQAFAAVDGDLGGYLREEMRAKGIHAVPRGCFDNGFQQLTCATKPIRSVADLAGLKVRTPDTALYKELFQALGAVSVPTTINKMYDTLKSGAAEAQTDPLTIVELFKLYEVQKYVSMTNHLWAGFNLIANLKVWQGLPEDARGAIERNAAKFVRTQRQENAALNGSLRARLTQQGMTFNDAETGSFRARLGPFYAHWKETVGPRAWGLLEAHAGKLA